MGQRWPDCDPDLHDWVTQAVKRLDVTLGSNLVGTYLHGSLAGGSFYSPKSDVDVLFVCERPLSVATRRSFARDCVAVSRGRPIIGGLECAVVLRDHAQQAIYPMPIEVAFKEDWVDAIMNDEVDYHATNTDADLAAHCQSILEVGIVLNGSPIATTFGPVRHADFMESVTSDLDWILEGDNIVSSPFYAVLNSCRMLWLWEGHSERLTPSKEEAALWCMEKVPDAVGQVIGHALEVYRSNAPVTPEERRTGGQSWDRAQLLAFRDYVIAQRAAAAS